jgi:hypothetical protein
MDIKICLMATVGNPYKWGFWEEVGCRRLRPGYHPENRIFTLSPEGLKE